MQDLNQEAKKMTKTQWENTRRYVKDLRAEGDDDSIPENTDGYLYQPGCIEGDGKAGFCFSIYGENFFFSSLEKAETYLWDNFAKDIVAP